MRRCGSAASASSRSSRRQQALRASWNTIGRRNRRIARRADRGVQRGRRRPRAAVLLRPGHGDAGRPAREEHAPGLALQHREHGVDVVPGLAVQRRGQADPGTASSAAQQLGLVVVPDEQGHRPEALLEERLGSRGDGCGIRRQHDRLGGAGSARRAARDDRHRRVGLEVLDAGGEGVGDAVGEQRSARDAGHGGGDELFEARRRAGTKTTPGLVQNCPTPSVNEPTRPCASVSPRAARAPGVMTTGLTLPSSP